MKAKRLLKGKGSKRAVAHGVVFHFALCQESVAPWLAMPLV